ncbi:DUF4132 domain-containing protein [Streptomyces sp. NPDC058667]|uniref:DUF4132 domain-containing protein n=1 Tax=Streptomyces sp. NPDC058667 TaxID=3346588 RepID=UPI0036604E27
MDWVAVDGIEQGGSGRPSYELALDAYAEPHPTLICRNASGKVLKKVPPQARKHERAELLLALADWLADHTARAAAEAERWMTRSLPVPARLLRAVWPDPYWQRALRHLVVAPYEPDGSADVTRAGLLVDAGRGTPDGLRVARPEGELTLTAPLVTVPHPVLLDPDGRGRLELWRRLLDAYGGEQGVEQLRRTVWWRPRAAPANRHSWHGVDAFDGAEFDSGARFERAVSRFGGRIRGETACFDLHAGPARHPMRIELRWQGPLSSTVMDDVHWGHRDRRREGPGAYDDIPLVAWSEGMRAAAHLYDARDGGYRQEDRPDASAAYQRFLTRCAENTGGGDEPGAAGGAPEAWEEKALLDAGAVAPGATPGADDEDVLTVCRYDWAALDEGACLVRLVPGGAADAEDTVARALGLAPVPDGGPGREVVGRVRPAPPGFLARVSRAEPSAVTRAIGLLGLLRTCATTAATKPGRAAKALETAVAPLEQRAPRLMTAVLDEGARIVADAGSPGMAQPLFARAREVENNSGLAVDEDGVIESFVAGAAVGAVSRRALAAHHDALVARSPAPSAAAAHYRRLVLAWHRAALPSRPEFAGAVLGFTPGTAPVDEEHRQLLVGLLTHGGMDDATTDVWDGWTPVLLALLAEGRVTRKTLLELTAAPTGSGRAALTDAAAGWVSLLRKTGTDALLTGAAGEAARAGVATVGGEPEGPVATRSDGEADGTAGTRAGGKAVGTGAPLIGREIVGTGATRLGGETHATGAAASVGGEPVGTGAAPDDAEAELVFPAVPVVDAEPTVDSEDVRAWLNRFAQRYRGLRAPVDGLHEVLAGAAARLRAGGATHRALPSLRMPDSQASARDRCVDLGLLDALLAAGVPVDTDGTEPLGFLAWLGRAKGDDLPYVTRDDRFAPRLLAELSDPTATLAIGPPSSLRLTGDTGRLRTLATRPALHEFVTGLLGEHGRRVAEGGVLPLHTALRDLEPFAAPAVRRHFEDEAERILAVDPAVALARTLRAGLPDELGLPGEGAAWQWGEWTEIRDGGDALLLAGGGRAVAMQPEGVVTQWEDEAYDYRKPWPTGLLWRDGAFETEPYDGRRRLRSPAEPAECEPVFLPGDDVPRTVHRVIGVTDMTAAAREHGELRGPDGSVVAAWPLTGNGVFGFRRARWAAGSPFTPAPGWWHALRPRDAAGSARLRAMDTATAEHMLAAVGQETYSALDFLAGSRSGARGVHETTVRVWGELGGLVRKFLPEVTDDRLVDGLTGVLWSTVECARLRARARAFTV